MTINEFHGEGNGKPTSVLPGTSHYNYGLQIVWHDRLTNAHTHTHTGKFVCTK